jgi:hypothetical protein
MALLDFPRRPSSCFSHPQHLPHRAVRACRHQSRFEIAVEVAKTMLSLMLIALFIAALRYALVVAHGAVR